MKKDPRIYLVDILDAIEHIEGYVKGFSLDDFRENLMLPRCYSQTLRDPR